MQPSMIWSLSLSKGCTEASPQSLRTRWQTRSGYASASPGCWKHVLLYFLGSRDFDFWVQTLSKQQISTKAADPQFVSFWQAVDVEICSFSCMHFKHPKRESASHNVFNTFYGRGPMSASCATCGIGGRDILSYSCST